jgi:Secretion system C-terminal sorting domain
MKYLASLFILLFTSLIAIAQCPTTSPIQLESQSDVEAYVQNYGSCTYLNELEISNSVEDISGLKALTKIDYLYFNNCPMLRSLNGLHNLDTITYNLGFYNQTGFKYFCELDNLKFIGRDLRLEGTKNIESLAGLKNITAIGDDITIEGNESLENLHGLEHLKQIGNNDLLTIANNPLLTNGCGVKNLLLSQANIETIITNNAPGCNSKDEILASPCTTPSALCIASNNEVDAKATNIFYPNPFQNTLYINTDALKIIAIDVFNSLGSQAVHVDEVTDNLDLSRLNQGMYLIVVKTNANVLYQKVMKTH